jgi:hypothetical protein
MMKKCTKCQQHKQLNEFRNDKYAKDGKTTRCKECLSKLPRDWDPEIRCYYCQRWFSRKQRNWKFCTKKCHDRYWRRNWKLSVKGFIWNVDYQKQYSRSNGEECIDCGKIVSNGSKRCEKCHCIMMSRKANEKYIKRYQVS